MSDLQTDNAKKLFNLTKLAETEDTKADSEDESDNTRLKKFFKPTIFNLSDIQETSPQSIA